jgi:hypothetical protein
MSRCCHGEEECMVYHAEASLGAMMEPAAWNWPDTWAVFEAIHTAIQIISGYGMYQ